VGPRAGLDTEVRGKKVSFNAILKEIHFFVLFHLCFKIVICFGTKFMCLILKLLFLQDGACIYDACLTSFEEAPRRTLSSDPVSVC
jgi:hypothetical protein